MTHQQDDAPIRASQKRQCGCQQFRNPDRRGDIDQTVEGDHVSRQIELMGLTKIFQLLAVYQDRGFWMANRQLDDDETTRRQIINGKA